MCMKSTTSPSREEVWSIDLSSLDEIRGQISRFDCGAATPFPAAAVKAGVALPRIGRVAVADIQGPMTMAPTMAQRIFGGTVVAALAEGVRLAAADPSVNSIVLTIDSPGGSAGAAIQLAMAVKLACAEKIVVAHVSGLAAGSAYLVASQATRILTTPAAMVGGLGVYALVESGGCGSGESFTSKIHVMRPGKINTAGTHSNTLSEQRRNALQDLVNATHDLFFGAVHRGRRVSLGRVRDFFGGNGSLHLAADAEMLGLVDGIRSFAHVIADLNALGACGTECRALARL